MSGDPELGAYFEEAASWEVERVQSSERAARLARWVAGGFAVIAVGAVASVVALTPLKRVEPFLIRVDNSSGVVDIVPAYTGAQPVGEVVTRYLLTHYVMTCERFIYAVAEQDYTECGAFHAAQRNLEWASQWAVGNPASPLNRYRDGTTVRVEVQTVSFFERTTGAQDLAQVRFLRAMHPGGAGAEQTTHWLATIHYAYGKPPSDPKVRRWNPLGFRILSYQLEPEVNDGPANKAAAAL